MGAKVVEVWEKSLVETLTYRGYERRWVEPGSRVIVGSWRTRLFTEEEWHALFPPSGPEWEGEQ
jgi:hypothetical protein